MRVAKPGFPAQTAPLTQKSVQKRARHRSLPRAARRGIQARRGLRDFPRALGVGFSRSKIPTRDPVDPLVRLLGKEAPTDGPAGRVRGATTGTREARGRMQGERRGSGPRQAGDLSSPESGPVTRHIFAGSESGKPRSPGKGRAAPAQTASVRPLLPRRRWGRSNSRTRPGFRVPASRARERTETLPLPTRAGAAPEPLPAPPPGHPRGPQVRRRSDHSAVSPLPSLPQGSRSGSSARPLQSLLWLSLPSRGSLAPLPRSRHHCGAPGPGQHLLGR